MLKYFNDAYKYGYKLEQIIPAHIDAEVVKEWTEGDKIIFYKQNEERGNFLIACIDDTEGEGNIIYSFIRFFNLGNNTQCSVDFKSSSLKQMIRQLTDLLSEKYSD